VVKSEFERIKEVFEYMKEWLGGYQPMNKKQRKEVSEYVDVILYELQHVEKELSRVKEADNVDRAIDILLNVDNRLVSIRSDVENLIVRIFRKTYNIQR